MGGSAWTMTPMRMYKKNIILLMSCCILLVPAVSFAAGTKQIGDTCSVDSECVTNQCENSKGKGAFCVCGELDLEPLPSPSPSCNQRYGASAGDTKAKNWLCKDGADATWDLNYCINIALGKGFYPTPPGEISAVDLFLDTTAATEILGDELQELIDKPTLRISIPGLSFTDKDELVQSTDEDGATYIHFPFLGEYISAVFKYAIATIGAIAVIMIIVAGFTWITSGGSSERVSEAKKRIQQSIVGLFLAVSSYTLLYTINPELVSFRNLRVLTIPGISSDTIAETAHETSPGLLPAADKTVVKTFTIISEPNAEDFKKDSINGKSVDGHALWDSLSDAQKGTVLPHLYSYIGECPIYNRMIPTGVNHGNFKNRKLAPEVIPALEKAATLATQYGYELYLGGQNSAYRDTKTQTQLWNTGVVARFLQNRPRWKDNEGLIAKPSCSAPHATGGAIDIGMKKNGKIVVSPGNTIYKTKTISDYKEIFFKQNPPYRLILEEIMRQADWVRFCKEYWHFETAVTVRYSKWDKADDTRCVFTYIPWKTPIPEDTKANANAAVNGTIFK